MPKKKPKKKRRTAGFKSLVKKNKKPPQDSLLVIDRFSNQDLVIWENHKNKVLDYQAELYAVLARQRSQIYPELKQALLSSCDSEISDKWQRVVHVKYCNNPLSPKGSILNDPGGRFNIGSIDESRFEPFPALYLATDKETALLESFASENLNQALERASNFSSFEVEVKLKMVLNLCESKSLEKFLELIRNFSLPPHLEKLANEIGFNRSTLATNLDMLFESITATNWRVAPMQFDIPANCQILGRIAYDAKIDAIKYLSCRNKKPCLAVFTSNLDSECYVRISGETQDTLKFREINSTSHAEVMDF